MERGGAESFQELKSYIISASGYLEVQRIAVLHGGRAMRSMKLSRRLYYAISIALSFFFVAVFNYKILFNLKDEIHDEIIVIIFQITFSIILFIISFEFSKGTSSSLVIVFLMIFLAYFCHNVYSIFFPGDFNFGLSVFSLLLMAVAPLIVFKFDKKT